MLYCPNRIIVIMPSKKLRPVDSGYKSPGRPSGSKNMKTLLDEAVRSKSEHIMMQHFPKIVEIICEKAAKGDLKAAKMIMDRVIPARKAIEHHGTQDFGKDGIQIIINTVEGDPKPKLVGQKTTNDTEKLENAQ